MFQHTPVQRVPSSEASNRTRRRRRDDLVERRKRISGGEKDAAVQFNLEVKTLTKDERQKLLEQAGVTTIDATQSLAIKADLSIPWYRLRILRR